MSFFLFQFFLVVNKRVPFKSDVFAAAQAVKSHLHVEDNTKMDFFPSYFATSYSYLRRLEN